MVCTVDFGNTHVKAAYCTEDKIEPWIGETQVGILHRINEDLDMPVIVSSVSSASTHFINLIENKKRLTVLSTQLHLPLRLNYHTPLTLGMDRLAAAVGAYDLFPNTDSLVMDMGTCITYDVVTARGTFEGGHIVPGLFLRFKAMHNYTASLPIIQEIAPYNLPGKNTIDCMMSGVIESIVGELHHFMQVYREKYPQIQFILTGGDAIFFEKKLKQPIFAAPTLIMRGLYRVWKDNV